MNLHTYFKTHSQRGLAASLGITSGAVSQWILGKRPIPAERCIEIEKATDRQVKCEDLRPDIEWQFIRACSCQAGAANSEQKQPPALDSQAAGATAG